MEAEDQLGTGSHVNIHSLFYFLPQRESWASWPPFRLLLHTTCPAVPHPHGFAFRVSAKSSFSHRHQQPSLLIDFSCTNLVLNSSKTTCPKSYDPIFPTPHPENQAASSFSSRRRALWLNTHHCSLSFFPVRPKSPWKKISMLTGLCNLKYVLVLAQKRLLRRWECPRDAME